MLSIEKQCDFKVKKINRCRAMIQINSTYKGIMILHDINK